MLVNIDAEMSEILSVYPHFQSLAAPFHSVEYENWVTEVGRSLYAKGGGSLVRKVLIELRHAPEGYSEDFLSYLTMLDIRASRHTGPVRQEPDGR